MTAESNEKESKKQLATLEELLQENPDLMVKTTLTITGRADNKSPALSIAIRCEPMFSVEHMDIMDCPMPVLYMNAIRGYISQLTEMLGGKTAGAGSSANLMSGSTTKN